MSKSAEGNKRQFDQSLPDLQTHPINPFHPRLVVSTAAPQLTLKTVGRAAAVDGAVPQFLGPGTPLFGFRDTLWVVLRRFGEPETSVLAPFVAARSP